LRIILVGALGFVGLLAVGAAALLLLVDASHCKARLEAAASRVLGMEVSIGGRVGIAFFPGLLVTLADVHIRSRGAEVASAKEAKLGIDLFPLFWKEIRIEKIVLNYPRISIERDRDGQFNFEMPGAAGGTSPALDWPSVSLSDGTLVYADRQFGEGFDAADCRLDMHRLRLSGGKRSNLMKDLSFTAELACGEVRHDGFTVSDLKFSADAKNDVIVLEPVTTRVFGTQGSGSIQADFSGAVPIYHVRYSLTQFPIEEFFKAMSRQTVAAGRMDFSANLSMQGKTEKEMRQTLKGQITLRGKNLTLSGSDLDRELSRFESSQNFNLVDAGAFFFAGPLGLVVTKGYDFASLFRGAGGSSEIRTLVSDWKVERGVAQAQDVAMATKQNRIALQGGLDFVNDKFDDVTVALIDAKGCAKVRQKIRGTFQNPVVEKPNFLTSLVGPALSLLKKGSALLFGGQCEVFYAGSVAAPK
jgi:AsmA protein